MAYALRYAIKSARSSSFFKPEKHSEYMRMKMENKNCNRQKGTLNHTSIGLPAKTILVPGMYALGLSKYSNKCFSDLKKKVRK